jgi:hypothetical protein
MVAAWLAGGGALAAFAQTSTPIYVTIVMHSEQGTHYESNAILFEINRTNLFDFARGLFVRGAMFNFQSDWTFLAGVTNFDPGHPETGGTNIIAWMQDDLGFEIDPHNHSNQSEYNCADVAALISACGARPTTVAGGFIALPPESNEWPLLQQTITGAVYTATTWRAGSLWGSGTAAHAGPDQTNLYFSGIYCPQDVEHFYVHQPGNPPVVGGYGGRDDAFTNLDRLIALRDAGQLCTGKLYTVNLMANMGAMDPAYTLDFLAHLDSYAGVPNLRFVGLSQLTNLWATDYGSEPSYLPWSQTNDYDEDGMIDGWEVTNFCGIVAADGTGDFDGDRQSDGDEYVAGTSPTNESERFELMLARWQGEVAWTAVTGRVYEVEMDSGVGWTSASYCVTGSAPLEVWTNTIETTSVWFRVRATRP